MTTNMTKIENNLLILSRGLCLEKTCDNGECKGGREFADADDKYYNSFFCSACCFNNYFALLPTDEGYWPWTKKEQRKT